MRFGCNMENVVESNLIKITSVKNLPRLMKETAFSHLMELELIWEELGPKFKDLLVMGVAGVVASVIAASQRLHNHEHKRDTRKQPRMNNQEQESITNLNPLRRARIPEGSFFLEPVDSIEYQGQSHQSPVDSRRIPGNWRGREENSL